MPQPGPASFWWENVIAVVILLHVWVLARMLQWQKWVIKMLQVLSFCDQECMGLTSFNKDNSANYSGESKAGWSCPWYLLLENKWKNFESNFLLLIILILQSKAQPLMWAVCLRETRLKSYHTCSLPCHTDGAHIFRTMSQRAQYLGLFKCILRACLLIRGAP